MSPFGEEPKASPRISHFPARTSEMKNVLVFFLFFRAALIESLASGRSSSRWTRALTPPFPKCENQIVL